ncbi:MAG: asparagine synthase (glutamine-hydrolyzing) [Saprospiraceae bacterium]
MCGISGAFVFGGRLTERDRRHTRWSAERMRRRGPDSGGHAEAGQVVMGFRRLAIRDLSAAADQPMRDPSGRYLLTFNGELYHTDRLKALLPPDTVYRTHSDTEVLMHCLAHWGAARALPLLDGMFALAWYDSACNTLTIARDRCGIKPLYYALNERLLLFSSEYDLLLCHGDFRDAAPNPDALAHYLRLGFVPDGEALYRQTWLLPHGHYLCVGPDGASELRNFAGYPWKRDDDSPPDLGPTLADSVRSQLAADVPLGVFQSGGIDSSLVSVFAHAADPRLTAYTIGVAGGGAMDESAAARALTRALSMRHCVRTIAEADLLSGLIDRHVDAFSEPFADYSSLPMLLLAEFARSEATVALSGDGGDELFWGYPRHRHAAAYAPLLMGKKTARAVRLLRAKLSNSSVPVPLNLLQYADFADFALQKTYIAGARAWAGRIFPHKAATPFFFEKISAQIRQQAPEDVSDWMNILRKIEFDFHLQRVLLKVDRAGMRHSLEVRVPLLSNAMLEASLAFDYADCIGPERGKLPLRRLLAQSLPGQTLSALPKKGFTVPIDDWIGGPLGARFAERLRAIPAEWSAYFDPAQLEALWQSCRSEKNAWLVWAVFALFEWTEKRLDPLRRNFQSEPLCLP